MASLADPSLVVALSAVILLTTDPSEHNYSPRRVKICDERVLIAFQVKKFTVGLSLLLTLNQGGGVA